MLSTILFLALVAISGAQRDSRVRPEKLPRLTYSNFEERLLKIGITPDGTDLPFAEEYPFQIHEYLPQYKVVRFPAAKWICTQEYRYEADDPFLNWRERFDNDGYKATNDNPDIAIANVMFNRLFRYILGVNSESTTVPVTKPIIQRRTPEKSRPGPSQFWKHELCFWAGSDYNNKDLPGVLDDKTYIVKTGPFSAFVSRFGGYALSDADWNRARDTLMERMGAERRAMIDGPKGNFWSVAYDTPKKLTDRRNEVWIPIQEGAPVLRQEKTTLESTVLKTKNDYEVRSYDDTTWICAKTVNFSAPSDPLLGWQKKFDDNPFKLFVSDTWQNSAINKMHEKVRAYLYGVNAEIKKFPELFPIIVIHKPNDETNILGTQTLCSWLGDEYRSKTPPAPVDPTLFVLKKEAHTVYAKTFGGYALSYQDFGEALTELNDDMTANGEVTNAKTWVQAFYDTFYKISARRNEVMVEDVLE